MGVAKGKVFWRFNSGVSVGRSSLLASMSRPKRLDDDRSAESGTNGVCRCLAGVAATCEKDWVDNFFFLRASPKMADDWLEGGEAGAKPAETLFRRLAVVPKSTWRRSSWRWESPELFRFMVGGIKSALLSDLVKRGGARRVFSEDDLRWLGRAVAGGASNDGAGESTEPVFEAPSDTVLEVDGVFSRSGAADKLLALLSRGLDDRRLGTFTVDSLVRSMRCLTITGSLVLK